MVRINWFVLYPSFNIDIWGSAPCFLAIDSGHNSKFIINELHSRAFILSFFLWKTLFVFLFFSEKRFFLSQNSVITRLIPLSEMTRFFFSQITFFKVINVLKSGCIYLKNNVSFEQGCPFGQKLTGNPTDARPETKIFWAARPKPDPTRNCPKTRKVPENPNRVGSESFFGPENPSFPRVSEHFSLSFFNIFFVPFRFLPFWLIPLKSALKNS